ncbi:MAG: hypothetical protein IJ756_07455 [Paludibacteraceae bacterium]|nr:hypothetical protein [Paludibacteraceae bacterium]
MDADITNFQKFIIRKIVKSVEYNTKEDEFIFNRCDISDSLISAIVKEGYRYGMSEKDVRQFITTTSSNIKTLPSVKSVVTNFDISKVPIGQHLRLNIKHKVKGHQWVECLKMKNFLFILSSSISELTFGVRITPHTTLWSAGFAIDFSFQPKNEAMPIRGLILRLENFVSVEMFNPSVVHEILDSPKTFAYDEKLSENKKTTKKLTLTQRETEILILIEIVEQAIIDNDIESKYNKIKSDFTELGLSSYLLNTLITTIKNSNTLTTFNSATNTFDEHFFFYKQTDFSDEQKKNATTSQEQESYLKKIIKIEQTKNVFIFFTIILFGILMVFIALHIESVEELRQQRIDINKKNTEISKLQQKSSNLQKSIDTISNYTFTTGSNPKNTSSFDTDWVMWLEAKQDLVLDYLYMRGKEYGNVTIYICNKNDKIVKKIKTTVNNSEFKKVYVGATLTKGCYYIRRVSGVSLQYHSSSTDEFSLYRDGALVIMGCCAYSNRHLSKDSKGYYQYYYNLQYHLTFQ